MDTMIMSLLCATQSVPLLLKSRIQASGGTGYFALLHELLYSSWLRVIASDGKKRETVSTNDWSKIRSSFLESGYTGWGSLDNDSVQAQRDTSESACKVSLSWVYASDEVMGESDKSPCVMTTEVLDIRPGFSHPPKLVKPSVTKIS